MNMQRLANITRGYFSENAKGITVLEQDAPQWIHDMVIASHLGLLPNDFSYNFIVASLDAIAEYGDEDTELFTYQDMLEPDIYYHDLVAWLGSNNERIGRCEEIMEEMDGLGFVDVIQQAQLREMEEVMGVVYEALQDQLEELAETEQESEVI